MSNTPPPQAPRETIPRPLHLAAAAADSTQNIQHYGLTIIADGNLTILLVVMVGYRWDTVPSLLLCKERKMQMWCRTFGLSQVEGFEINSVKTLKQLIDRLNGSALPCARNSEWGICGKSVFSPQWIGPSHRLRWESECFAAWLISD